VRNAHDFPIKIAIEDQIPVSETEDIQVEVLPVTTPPTTRDLRDRRGVLEWAFEAKPGESREIKARLAAALAEGQGSAVRAAGVVSSRYSVAVRQAGSVLSFNLTL